MAIPQKQRATPEDWREALQSGVELYPADELERLTEGAIKEMKARYGRSRTAVAWSGGKDSQVLLHVAARAGFSLAVIVLCELEYPAFLRWLDEPGNAPYTLARVNTGQDLEWLARNEERMLFPRDAATSSKWFSIVQHRGQREFFKEYNLHALFLGRRRADGNYVGRNGENSYRDRYGVTRYSPLADWPHEAVLQYLRTYEIPLPPFYDWPNGYRVGTGPWAKRRATSTEEGYRAVYDIDPTIVHGAAEYLDSARAFLEGRG